jgi:hypothetical protein
MSRLSIDSFTAFFRWYKGLPHQDLAIATLWKAMPVSLLEEDADWVQVYRDPAIEEDPEVPVVLVGKDQELSWGSVLAMAKLAGAKYPEVAAAQCVLESGWFKHESGHNNILGIKATGNEPATVCTTQEWNGSKMVTIQDRFKDFDSYQDCIQQLVDQWYHDFRGYKGVNRAQSVGECCQLLRQEGYATDPHYASKLMSIINRQAG